jgi:hypothetical protein
MRHPQANDARVAYEPAKCSGALSCSDIALEGKLSREA